MTTTNSTPPRFEYAPAPSTVRLDLADAAVASVGILGASVVIFIALLATGRVTTWEHVRTFAIITMVIAYLPIIFLVLLKLDSVRDRHTLQRARSGAERSYLDSLYKIDANKNGRVDKDELTPFLDYVRYLHQGGKTTAAVAQEALGISGPTWQSYKEQIVELNLGYTIKSQGGVGFALHDTVRKMSYEKIEDIIRRRLA